MPYTKTELTETERYYERAAKIGANPERIVADPNVLFETADGIATFHVGSADRCCLIGLLDLGRYQVETEAGGASFAFGDEGFLFAACRALYGMDPTGVLHQEGHAAVGPVFTRALEQIRELKDATDE